MSVYMVQVQELFLGCYNDENSALRRVLALKSAGGAGSGQQLKALRWNPLQVNLNSKLRARNSERLQPLSPKPYSLNCEPGTPLLNLLSSCPQVKMHDCMGCGTGRWQDSSY